MNIDLIILICILGAAQGVFLAIILFLKKHNITANRVLAVAMIVLSFGILSFIFFAYKIYNIFPYMVHITGFAFPLPFLFGPIMFLYAKIICSTEKHFKKTYLLHFLPYIIIILYMMPFWLNSSADKMAFIQNVVQSNRIDIFLINKFKVVHGLIYVFFTIRIVQKYNRDLKKSYSNIEKINLVWLRNITMIIAAVWSLVAVLHILLIFKIRTIQDTDMIIGLVTAIAVYSIGYLGLRQPEIFLQQAFNTDLSASKQPASYKKSGLDDKKGKSYLKNLLNHMENEKPYLNEDLTLLELADHLSITAHNLSELINTKLQQNFYDFVNKYRIEEVKRKLADTKNKNLTILAMAYDSGFKSKSSFNSIFKKHTHITPSEYLKSISKP